MIVQATYKLPNGVVATFDYNGNQIGELQGLYSVELESKIRQNSDDRTEWHGFGKSDKSPQETDNDFHCFNHALSEVPRCSEQCSECAEAYKKVIERRKG